MNSDGRSPNFFMIGATKSGTTSLHHYLNQHPQIFLPGEKELQFFSDDALFQKGKAFYLRNYFAEAEAFPVRGEATPTYLHQADIVIPRLKEFFPDAPIKFIVLLRDPVKRAWSHYLHMVRLGEEPLSFEDALEAESRRLAEAPLSWYGYFSEGLYCRQLKQWFDAYPPESFLVLKQEQLAGNVDQVLEATFDFLGVDPEATIADRERQNEAGEARSKFMMKILMGKAPGMGLIKSLLPITFRRRLGMKLRHMNVRPTSSTPVIRPETAALLRQKYDDDIAGLERLLHRSFASWRNIEV